MNRIIKKYNASFVLVLYSVDFFMGILIFYRILFEWIVSDVFFLIFLNFFSLHFIV